MANTKWAIDPTHSEITFKVKHLMISTVTGQFKNFDLNVETASDTFDAAQKIEFTADIASIDTNNGQRDEHLKSADFFDAAVHPQLTFNGTKYEGNGGGDGKLYGNLTLRGVTQPVVLDAEFGGLVVDPYGQIKAGFTVSGKLSRKNFGLLWNGLTESGGVVVSDEIKINAEVQLVKQA